MSAGGAGAVRPLAASLGRVRVVGVNRLVGDGRYLGAVTSAKSVLIAIDFVR